MYCPCLCCLCFWVESNLCRFLFIYICSVFEHRLIKRGMLGLTGLSRHICKPVQSQNNDFQRVYVMVFFVINDLWWEIVIHFVDIDVFFLPSPFKLSYINTSINIWFRLSNKKINKKTRQSNVRLLKTPSSGRIIGFKNMCLCLTTNFEKLSK